MIPPSTKAYLVMDDKILASDMIMGYTQLAEDCWTAYSNTEYAKQNKRYIIFELRDMFNTFRMRLKNNYRNRGHVEVYDEMLDCMANTADELNRHVDAMRAEMQIALTNLLPYQQRDAFVYAAQCGTFVNLANQTYKLAWVRDNAFLLSVIDKLDDLLNTFEIWGDVTKTCNGERVNDIMTEMVKVCNRDRVRPKREPKQVNIRPQYNISNVNASLDAIAKNFGL